MSQSFILKKYNVHVSVNKDEYIDCYFQWLIDCVQTFAPLSIHTQSSTIQFSSIRSWSIPRSLFHVELALSIALIALYVGVYHRLAEVFGMVPLCFWYGTFAMSYYIRRH